METKKLNQMAGIQEKVMEKEKELKYIKNLQNASASELTRWQQRLKEKRTRQDFFPKDKVIYCGNKWITYGIVIEMVKAGKYPNTFGRVRGYYKDYLSYVVQLTYLKDTKIISRERDTYRWCSGKRLTLIGRKIKGINSKNRS